MQDRFSRIAATFIIWAAFTAIMIWGRYPNVSELNAVLLTGVMALAAAFSTYAVWRNQPAVSEEQAVKAKRRGKVDLLVQSLDEQELADLRERLMADTKADGEQVSLEDLMHQQRQ